MKARLTPASDTSEVELCDQVDQAEDKDSSSEMPVVRVPASHPCPGEAGREDNSTLSQLHKKPAPAQLSNSSNLQALGERDQKGRQAPSLN